MAKAEKKIVIEFGEIKREIRLKAIPIKKIRNEIIPEIAAYLSDAVSPKNAESENNALGKLDIEDLKDFMTNGDGFIMKSMDFVIDKLATYTNVDKTELEDDFSIGELYILIIELLKFNSGGDLGKLFKGLMDYIKMIIPKGIENMLNQRMN